MADIFQPQPKLDTVRVRTERVLKFVSQRLLTTEEALREKPLEAYGLDPDMPSGQAVLNMLKNMTRAEVLAWISESGMLENEVALVHSVRVYINGLLAHEEDMT